MRSPRLWALRVAALAGLTLVVPAPVAHADKASVPYDNTIRITGAGFGHGWGMSQWGAYGAAQKGLTWRQITAFYYPGTTVTTLPAGDELSVWLTADNDRNLTVAAATGLTLRSTSNGKAWALPTGKDHTEWRIVRAGSTWELYSRNAARSWVKRTHPLSATAPLQFVNPTAGMVSVVLPSGAVRKYRDRVGLILDGSTLRTVNLLSMENYLRGVVASEMPASWSPQALRTQSVAARTYAARLRNLAGSRAYDLCDTTTCQVYTGVSGEHPNTDAAIKATAGAVLTYGGKPINALFSASNGGHTADGKEPYLPAKPDPYDGGMTDQRWTLSVTAAQLGSRFGVGTVRSVQVTARDGAGAWGGRVGSVRIVGSTRTVTVSGATMRSTFGLRSTLFLVTGGVAPASGTYQRWQSGGGVTGRMGAPTGDQHAVTGGTRAPFAGGTVYASSAGTHEVRGAILRAYTRVNGPVLIGMPTTGEVAGPVSGSRMNSFGRGDIYYSAATDSHVVHGAILTTYRRIDGPTLIGLPTSDEVAGPVNGSRMNSFARGTIYYSGATGAHEVHGAIHTAYRRLDGPKLVGLPVAGEEAGTRAGVRISRFSRGAILYSGATGAKAVVGDAWKEYQARGREAGRLGLPTKDSVVSDTSSTTVFQGGQIRCTTTAGCRTTYS